jgi:hypothetical protein
VIFSVPYNYEVYGVRPGRAKPSRFTVAGRCDVDIPIVAEADAPVTIEWDDSVAEGFLSDADRLLWGPVPADGRQFVRYHANSHWTRVIDTNAVSETVATFMTPEDVYAHLNGGHSTAGPFVVPSPLSAKNTEELPEGGIETAGWLEVGGEANSRSALVAAVRGVAAEHMVVDNILYRKCAVPSVLLLQLKLAGVDSDRRCAILRIVTDSDPVDACFSKFGLSAIARTYPLFSFQNAYEAARRVNSDRAGRVSADTCSRSHRAVFTPSYDRWQTGLHHLEEEVEAILRQFSSAANSYPPAMLRAFADVVETHSDRYSEGGVERLEESLENLRAAADPFRSQFGHVVGRIDRAMDIASDRPVMAPSIDN